MECYKGGVLEKRKQGRTRAGNRKGLQEKRGGTPQKEERDVVRKKRTDKRLIKYSMKGI